MLSIAVGSISKKMDLGTFLLVHVSEKKVGKESKVSLIAFGSM